MSRFEELAVDITLEEVAPGGRIGFVALSTDFNAEQDLRRMLPDDVEIFTNRVMYANPLTLENLRAMAGDIGRATAGIIPGVPMDVMIYGCTSGTIANGADTIKDLIQAERPGVEVTNPATAAVAAMKQLGVKRVSVLTPYIAEINRELLTFFNNEGIEVVNITGLGFEDDTEVTRIPPSEIARLATEVCDPHAEAMFISCTSVRATNQIELMEKQLDIPVVTSNQALVWHSLKLLNYPRPVQGFGKLLSLLGTASTDQKTHQVA